ncbi:clathrin light chain B-like isoform X2 [Brachionus plicatilis]|uniref:Clathrin light chain n=1 Tax=Brachionus plicatilis TaxID=10195 RepID=A0A3M7RTS2_BRAPC|nr:clathrin light chain B-like isoform X2 [Brachionus plicatilis]
MSDPFEAFESALKPNDTTGINNNAVDPAAEFLAQQQVEEAKIENNDFDAFGDFSSVPSSNPPSAVLSSGFEEDDPFGTTTSASVQNFEPEPTAEPDTESNEVPQQKSVRSSPDSDWIVVDKNARENSSDLYSAISTADKLINEPEKVKLWRDEQKKRLEVKDAEEEKKKNEWKEAAKKELDEWYKNRQDQLEKKHADNKTAESDLLTPEETEKGKEWEKLGKLCDFNPKNNKNNRDVSRFRSILLQLKQHPLIR